MNLGALPELLLSWIKTQGNILLQPGKVEPASPFKPGQEYRGSVLSQLTSGRHLVRVAGQELDMNLPANTRAGESVRLTFLHAGPRPTFLLNAPPVQSGQPVQLSAATQQVSALLRLAGSGQIAQQPGAQNANMTVTAPLATPARDAAIANVSGTKSPKADMTQAPVAGTSSTNSAVFSLPPSIGRLPPSSAIVSSRPVINDLAMLQAPASGGAILPAATAGASSSLPVAAVLGLRAAVPASTTLDTELLVQLPAPSSHILPERLAQTVRESGLFYEAHLTKWVKGEWPFEKLLAEPQNGFSRVAGPPVNAPELAGMSDDAAQMAGRQLQLLEGGTFHWLGLIWPGQWMRWLVEEQLDRQEQDEGAAERQWYSEVSLQLPSLGGVRARVGLTGNHLNLTLQTDTDPARERMRENLTDLAARLEFMGFQANCQVQADDHD